jgi:hypothetical protein
MITELNIYRVNTIEQYRKNWLQHINIMQRQDYRKENFSTDLQERDLRRPKKRW